MNRLPSTPERSRTPDRAARRASRSAIFVAATLLVGALAACEESPVESEPFAPVPCEPPANRIPSAALEGVSRANLRTAVLDAAGRITTSLSVADARELRSALDSLATHLGGNDFDTPCRVLHGALERLEELDDLPATRPDRIALRLVLDLVTAELATPEP